MEILFIIVIVAVIIYLVANNYVKNKSKPNLESKTKVEIIKGDATDEGVKTKSEIVDISTDSIESEYLDNYWIPVEQKRREVKINFFIVYKNTRLEISERQFDLESFSRGPKGYHLHGYCHKKNRRITLSSLGVISAKTIIDGNTIPNIIDLIENEYKKTVNFKKDSLFDEFGWAIYPLVYLASTSGSVVKKERDIILAFIKSIKEYEELSEEWIDKTIKELYRPGKMEVRNWIKKGISKKYNYELLFPWIDKLEAMQNESNREFKNFKKYIYSQLLDLDNENKA